MLKKSEISAASVLEDRSLRNLWLNPRYQGRHILWLTLAGLIPALVSSAVFYFFTRENYALLVDLSPMSEAAKAQLYKELWQILTLLIAGNFVFLVLVALIGLVFSHRTAGPLYHYKRVFNEVRGGNRDARLKLRPKDDFHDVADAFNAMMDSIAGK